MQIDERKPLIVWWQLIRNLSPSHGKGGGGRFCPSRIFSIAQNGWRYGRKASSSLSTINLMSFIKFSEKSVKRENDILVTSCFATLGKKAKYLRAPRIHSFEVKRNRKKTPNTLNFKNVQNHDIKFIFSSFLAPKTQTYDFF